MSVYVKNQQHHYFTEYLPKSLSSSLSKDGFFNLYAASKKAIKTITYWMERSRQRRELAKLSSYMLEDIGITYEQQQQEIAKPFWK